ncbi:MAG TPA: hypothetical protein PLD62_04520, partial [Candidatus Cloacimonadota bacterium]|nr:hypothetical protein [Candidatus Cloacimonadota bacterium]
MNKLRISILFLFCGLFLQVYGIPIKIGEFNEGACDFELVNNNLVSANQFELRIHDISDPATPQLIGNYVIDQNNCDTRCYSLCSDGNRIYLLNHIYDFEGNIVESEFLILDISNPEEISLSGRQSFSGEANSIACLGNNVYVTFASYLKGYDTTDPEQIMNICNLVIDGAYNINIYGNYAYVCCKENGMLIFSLENPANPVLLSSYGNGYKMYYAHVNDNVAYICNSNNGTIILDVDDPEN